MNHLDPKQFINQVFISELETLSIKNHYISFAIIAIGIEFLGKCLDKDAKDWNIPNRARKNFSHAIDSLVAFEKYRSIKDVLYEDLRCGFAHSFVPGSRLTLSSKNETENLIKTDERINIRCEDFYQDFKKACQEVIEMEFANDDKMSNALISIPGAKFNDIVESDNAITESFKRD